MTVTATITAPPRKLASRKLRRRPPRVVITPVLLDLHGAAAATALSPRGVERLLSRGLFPRPVRCGRLRRWTMASLVAWWAANGCGDAEGRA